jgi:bifunctional UDP-N-acetylglucosamine pyrophosphorylase / glucosamine-1-phosphate N-acetyltransferase
MAHHITMSKNVASLACIILAAGQGTRMRSTKAKVLHEVAGFPMIIHVRRACEAMVPYKIIGVIGPDAPEVGEAVAPHSSVVQKERKGTAHAVLAAKDELRGFQGRVLIVYGDTPLLRPETLSALVGQKAPVSVLTFEPADPAQYGRVFLSDEGLVDSIIEYADATPEQRKHKLCNAGVMAFDSDVLWSILSDIKPNNAKGEFYLTDAIAIARQRGIACGYVTGDAEEVLGINSRTELANAEHIMQQRLRHSLMEQGVSLINPETVHLCADTRIAADVVIHPFVVFGPSVVIDEGVDILSFSHLEGVRVKKGSRIGPYARLRPGTIVGEGAHIGNFVEIKKSTIEAGAKINHLSYVGDARVGARTNIGAGTITCNYDGFHKHYTDIGADVFVGSDTALVAPIKIGDRATIAAGSTITENVPEDSLGIARTKQSNKDGWAKRFRDKKGGK